MGAEYSSPVDSTPHLPVAQHIQMLIRSYPVMVFSKSNCPDCIRAKRVLSKYKLGRNYYVFELDRIPFKADKYHYELARLTGASTVPRVFIGGRCIGGATETYILHKQGRLKQLLRKVHAFTG